MTDTATAIDPQIAEGVRRSAELTRVIAAHHGRATTAAEERRALWAQLVDRGVPHRVLREAAGVSQSTIIKELRIARTGMRR